MSAAMNPPATSSKSIQSVDDDDNGEYSFEDYDIFEKLSPLSSPMPYDEDEHFEA
jgi:hypothetical protein